MPAGHPGGQTASTVNLLPGQPATEPKFSHFRVGQRNVKHILARSKDEIEREVYRLTPLVEAGGYIGFCDHLVPPDVSLDNYMFYLETVRRVWGKGIDLKPLRRSSSQEAAP